MKNNLGKIPLIIKREYLTRVRKRSFLIMTLVGPLLMAALVLTPYWLNKVETSHRTIVVVDQSVMFPPKSMANSEQISFDWRYLDKKFEDVHRMFRDSDNVSILDIQGDPMKANAIVLWSSKQPGLSAITYVQKEVEQQLEDYKMIKRDIDPDVIRGTKTQINIVNNVNGDNSLLEQRIIVGMVGAMIIYFFIFLFGTQIMRGVMEEKTNRIVEVIISSVRPFHLMMGKILGVSLVGLTQFALWIVLSTVVLTGAKTVFAERYDAKTVVQEFQQNQATHLQDNASPNDDKSQKMSVVFQSISNINWPVILGMFVFYFLGGYLLYGSLFAAIGSAVDSETDTQQFMLPMTIPLIIGFTIAMQVGLNDPTGPLATWCSIFPLTSPVVMMVRIPFGVPWYELLFSALMLIGAFLGSTWLSGRIYRIGILMYGQKISWKELGRWIRIRN
ncbi:MAG: ABC transporter permease [Flavobacteriales bacterium]|nr:ABC transporter permease [Flavobacteriales bacterium]MCB9447051.1 ABC transporter permease [Flavobacteriales bacterium]